MLQINIAGKWSLYSGVKCCFGNVHILTGSEDAYLFTKCYTFKLSKEAIMSFLHMFGPGKKRKENALLKCIIVWPNAAAWLTGL